MIPHAANEWFKAYITQLLELGLIEPCTGPWAAAVVLVPSNAADRAPRQRKARPMTRTPKLKMNANGKALAVYTMGVAEEAKKEDHIIEDHEEIIPSWTGTALPGYQVSDVAGISHEVTSETPTVEAGKKDPYRVCVNYKPVNKVMVDSGYPIPNINFLFTLLKDTKFYAVYDCLKGFWQLPLHENSRDLSGFACSMGQFRWTRLPMGMKLSPLAWQAQMDKIFFEELMQHFICYIDDGLTYSATFEDHLIHVETVLRKAEQAGLSLSIAKCKFGYSEVKLLGYIVSRAGLQMDPAKTLRILQWPSPNNIHELNRFIGVIQYYRRFIPHLSEMLASMHALKKKNVRYEWTLTHEEHFKTLKNALTMDPIMRHPDFDKKFFLFCDASNVAIGGVLAQENETEAGLYHPIFFGSKALSDAEKKISTYEKEFLAIVYFIHFFKQYLMGKHFVVYTDQKSLQYLIKFSEDASAKVVRWQASLIAYDFDIVYKAGKLNVHADAMSRLPGTASDALSLEKVMPDYYLPLNVVRKEPDDGFENENDSNRNVKSKTIWDDLQAQQLNGAAGMKLDLYKALSDYLIGWKYPAGYSADQRKALRHQARRYHVDKQGILYKNGSGECVDRRVVVHQKDVLRVLQECHDHVLAGHQGVGPTYQRVKQKYYWPGYYDTVRAYVQAVKSVKDLVKIGIDYIYAPKTAQGHSAALVIVDYLTSWVHAEPVSTQSASSTCLGLFKWICQYGCPAQIIADNGTHFSAIEISEYMYNTFHITLNFGPPYRPQRQGKVERANQTMKSILKKYLVQYHADWDLFLPAALFVMRTMVKIDGAYSPFVLTYGRPPRISSLENEDLYWVEEEIDEEAILGRIDELVILNTRTIPDAVKKMNTYKIKMKQAYDKKAKVKVFKVRDKVMLLDHSPNRWVPRWVGPFTIAECMGKDTYRLRDDHLALPTSYHGDQLKLYKARPKVYMPLRIDRGSLKSR
ncbi:hypothetical protein [Parasitella parasitica]|uniref:Integrase catalytic domain-containing protein n=1 Tax=Parasitella parasitica TaxID=35722 RepID=A0A0B7N4H6_9FUNG|nr:hypothetical protein [Parasitella parasitica]